MSQQDDHANSMESRPVERTGKAWTPPVLVVSQIKAVTLADADSHDDGSPGMLQHVS